MIAGLSVIDRNHRRRQFVGIGKIETDRLIFDDADRRPELFQHLDPALRLCRLAGFGAETIDETLQMLTLRGLFDSSLTEQFDLLAPDLLEAVVIAAIGNKLGLVDMDDA